MFRVMVLLVLLSTTSTVFADAETAAASKVQYDQYVQIEDSTTTQPPVFPTPNELMSLNALTANAEDLLKWAHKNLSWPAPSQKYNRAEHFGPWLSDPHDRPCLNTREKVLIRDSARTVDFGPDGCKIKSGEWVDPYAGETHTNPSKIQIDHMVPLKNAYISGASKWEGKARCVYANFMANSFHLIAVSSHENLSKSDRDPSAWLPPKREYLCTYLKNWLSVKMIWGLIMSEAESEAIKKVLADSRCNPRDFKISKTEVAKQRKAIAAEFDLCEARH